jgi:plastocyanin
MSMSIRHGHGFRRVAATLGVASFALLVSACGSSGSSASGSSASGSNAAGSTTSAAGSEVVAKPNQVQIKLIAFHPATLSVTAGTTVTWKQTDPGFHTITSGTVVQGSSGVTPQPDGKFASGQLATGKTFSHTFIAPGTYPYFCEIHPATMRGTVTVR